tara:strand:- start:15 stop:224 length:210 start_codon:yes stop_codon:yes gene_type:complete
MFKVGQRVKSNYSHSNPLGGVIVKGNVYFVAEAMQDGIIVQTKHKWWYSNSRFSLVSNEGPYLIDLNDV